MDNPIKDNRIVNDMTFAIRLKDFLKDTEVNDAMSEEELDYFKMVCDKLISYQVNTATDINEINYLERLDLYKKVTFGEVLKALRVTPFTTDYEYIYNGKGVKIATWESNIDFKTGSIIMHVLNHGSCKYKLDKNLYFKYEKVYGKDTEGNSCTEPMLVQVDGRDNSMRKILSFNCLNDFTISNLNVGKPMIIDTLYKIFRNVIEFS